MRKSVKKDDPGYDPQAYKYSVYFNGRLLHDCFTADEERGEAFVYERDGSGRLYYDDTGQLAFERKCGRVNIIKD